MVPKALQETALQGMHGGVVTGHLGFSRFGAAEFFQINV